MDLNKRQEEIIDIVKEQGPITGDQIANILNISRATIRPDLTVLTMIGLIGARPKVGYFYTGKTIINDFSAKISKIPVKDMMSIPVVMDENTSVYDVIVGLFLENISSVFITANGYLAGVVSRKDLLITTLGNMDLKNTPVAMIMTRMPNIVFVREDESVLTAARKIEDSEIDGLPVVSAKGDETKLKVVGRFTKTNVNRIFVELAREDA